VRERIGPFLQVVNILEWEAILRNKGKRQRPLAILVKIGFFINPAGPSPRLYLVPNYGLWYRHGPTPKIAPLIRRNSHIIWHSRHSKMIKRWP
jgi:hypothetical protein